jgi:hypothetical protein
LRKALVVDFKSRSQMEAWLGRQPREAAVVLAARAALRALPLVLVAKHKDFRSVLVLPVFRATVISWATAKYPTYQTELAAAAAAAYAAADASASATAVAIAAIDAAATRAAAFAADAYAAATAARAAAAAARAAATRPGDSYAGISAIRAAAYAAAYAGDAIYAAAYADARSYAVMAADSYDTARAAAYAGDAAVPFFWSEISTDATRLEEGGAASAIARLPLWPQGQPDELLSLWQ